MTQMKGKCSCGTVEYRFSKTDLLAYQCHCSICRKATGSAFTTTLMVPEKSFEWISGENNISTFTQDNGYTVSFCSSCGNPVPNKFRDFSLLCVPVGGIENSDDIEIVAHIFLGSKASWDTVELKGSQYQEMPSFQEMLAALHAEI